MGKQVGTVAFVAAAVVAVGIGFGSPGARASAGDPLALPNQVGAATAYVTPAGTAAWRYYVNAGDTADDEHFALVVLPASIDTTQPTPTVVALHGATGTEDQIGSNTAMRRVLDSWLDRGWAVIAPRGGSKVVTNRLGVKSGRLGTWGNERSRRGIVDAWAWTQSAWTPDPHGFLLYGWSMGATTGFNVVAEAQQRSVPIAALHSIDGATNLAYNFKYSSKFRANIAKAYGITATTLVTSTAWDTKVNVADGGHDPQLVTTHLVPFPVRLSASNADPTVNTPNNSTLLYSSLLSAGWTAELSFLRTSGGHCANSHFSPTDVNAFFTRALVPVG